MEILQDWGDYIFESELTPQYDKQGDHIVVLLVN
jgi:hypothetical protein